MISWIYLLIAATFEILMTSSLKLAENFSQFKWSALFVISAILSVIFLNKSIQSIPIGTAYSVWTGIGAAGTALMGILFYKESADFWRLFFLGMLILSIIGLKYVSGEH